jgi:excisionase family DNA binding protein
MSERLLTPGDVAEHCQVSTKTVLRAIHRGRLRASRLGEHGAYRMREVDVDEWIEACVVDLQPARSAPAAIPSGAPIAARSGRLVLTPEMGRER